MKKFNFTFYVALPFTFFLLGFVIGCIVLK